MSRPEKRCLTLSVRGEHYLIAYRNNRKGRRRAGQQLCAWASNPELSLTGQEAIVALTKLLNDEVAEKAKALCTQPSEND